MLSILRNAGVFCALGILGLASPALAQSAETPGLSPALSASPPYSCVTNFYVDGVNGNDFQPRNPVRAVADDQNADNGSSHTPSAGECVNVLPGTYTLSQTVVFSHGGNSNSPTGFVVYRSTVPQGAHIVVGSNFNTGSDLIQLWTGYLVVDGFEIDGGNSFTSGHGINGCANGGDTSYNVAHHFVGINNIIHGMGGAGLSTCAAEYHVRAQCRLRYKCNQRQRGLRHRSLGAGCFGGRIVYSNYCR